MSNHSGEREAALLAFVLRCSADNPAAIGKARNEAVELLERFGIDPRERGVFYHNLDADESNASSLLASPAPMPEVETIPNALEAAFAAMPETEVEQVTQGKLHEACEGALQWMEQLADRFEGEWPNTSAHCRIHVNTLRAALSTSAGEKGGGIAQMQRALVDHNDALRSAASVAGRDGKDTNWLTFRGHIHWILAEHHEITNEARAALGSAKESGE